MKKLIASFLLLAMVATGANAAGIFGGSNANRLRGTFGVMVISFIADKEATDADIERKTKSMRGMVGAAWDALDSSSAEDFIKYCHNDETAQKKVKMMAEIITRLVDNVRQSGYSTRSETVSALAEATELGLILVQGNNRWDEKAEHLTTEDRRIIDSIVNTLETRLIMNDAVGGRI